MRPYAGNTEFANSPYVITQAEDGSISIKARSETSDEQSELMKDFAEAGIATEKYETISANRYLTPYTFYGMDIESNFSGSDFYTQDSGKEISFDYKVVSTYNNTGIIEVDLNGEIYNIEVPIDIKSGKIDKAYLIGAIENIINPC